MLTREKVLVEEELNQITLTDGMRLAITPPHLDCFWKAILG